MGSNNILVFTHANAGSCIRTFPFAILLAWESEIKWNLLSIYNLNFLPWTLFSARIDIIYIIFFTQNWFCDATLLKMIYT